jgi:N-acetylneuraminic acid mutarotase
LACLAFGCASSQVTSGGDPGSISFPKGDGGDDGVSGNTGATGAAGCAGAGCDAGADSQRDAGTLDANDLDANDLDAFVAPGTWATLPSMQVAREGPAAAFGADERLYVMGGYDGRNNGQVYASVEVCTPSRNVWGTVASMPTARSELAAVAAPDGRIYAIGGEYSGPGVVTTVEAYTPGTNTWATVASMSVARVGHGATLGIDGRIYVMGGEPPYGQGGPMRSMEAYDPSTDQWTTLASMSTARSYFTAVTGRDGRIYAIGGWSGASYETDVEVYTPSTNTWSTYVSLPSGRRNSAGVLGHDGVIYIVGGWPTGQPSFLSHVIGTTTYNRMPDMLTPRTYHAVAIGPDGRIYAVGGGDLVQQYQATVEVYAP